MLPDRLRRYFADACLLSGRLLLELFLSFELRFGTEALGSENSTQPLNQRTCWGQFHTSETLLILLDSWVLRKSGTSRTSRQGQKCLWGVDVGFNYFLEGERMMIDSHIWGAKTSSAQSEAWWFSFSLDCHQLVRSAKADVVAFLYKLLWFGSIVMNS